MSNGASISCIVADLDHLGCKILMEGAINIPDQVEIVVPALGLKRTATVCWRTDREAGFTFPNSE